METVTVSADALEKVLQALIGAPHQVRELQVLMNSTFFKQDNPINTLLDEYNRAVEEYNAQLETGKEKQIDG